MLLQHEIGRAVELLDAGRAVRWRYVYAGKPKPFMHPLCTPAGHCVTLLEPHDHVWHRGLWYTIKFVNGDNFWEEKDVWGAQRLRVPPAIEHDALGAIRVRHDSEWVEPAGAVVIDESRVIDYAPLSDDAYRLDWTLRVTPALDVLLDRTPFTTWGGYGGLTLRGSRGWEKSRLLFDDGTTHERPTPKASAWCDLSGTFDGGRDQTGGVAILDHPGNPRHPTNWYGKSGERHYMNAAFLFSEPMAVAAGQSLCQRYRVIVHDGLWDASRLRMEFDRYVGERPPQ